MGFRIFKATDSTATDEALMLRVMQRADEKAFELLYDRYHSKLLWFSMRIVSSREQAEDIVQETFMKVIEDPQAFNASLKFSTWIYTLVNRASLNSKRNENNRSRLLNEYTFELPATYLHHHMDARLIQQHLNTIFKELNAKEQTVFILRFEHALSIKEISSIAQIPEGSVKSCLYYLLKKIASQLRSQQVI